MSNIIDVTEYGSNRKLSVVVSNILYIEPLEYRNGEKVTIITLTDKSTIHVIQTATYIKELINK